MRGYRPMRLTENRLRKMVHRAVKGTLNEARDKSDGDITYDIYGDGKCIYRNVSSESVGNLLNSAYSNYDDVELKKHKDDKDLKENRLRRIVDGAIRCVLGQ